jgi:hypothetical protein
MTGGHDARRYRIAPTLSSGLHFSIALKDLINALGWQITVTHCS